jgi:hypothetical protein
MNVQSTKLELMKIIADINSETLLARAKSWLLEQMEHSPAPSGKKAKNESSFITKDGFLVFTGMLHDDLDDVLNAERMKRDLSLM